MVRQRCSVDRDDGGRGWPLYHGDGGFTAHTARMEHPYQSMIMLAAVVLSLAKDRKGSGAVRVRTTQAESEEVMPACL